MLRLALIHGCARTAADYAEAARRVRGMQWTASVHAEDSVRQQSAAALGVATAAASLGELLQTHGGAFDAVLIRGPVSRRADIACQAAQAKKHVCLTTPAAASSADVDRIASACQAAGVMLMIGSRRQLQPTIAAVKSALDSGKLGTPALLRLHHWLPREPEATASCAVNERSAGRVWAEIVSHLHLALWTFGRPVSDLFASTPSRFRRDEKWPESLQLHLGFTDGGMALLSVDFQLPAGDGYDHFTVIGSTGAAYADDHAQRQLLYRGGSAVAVQSDDDMLTRAAQLRSFTRAVATKADASLEVQNMKAALQLADAAWLSLHERRAVETREADGH